MLQKLLNKYLPFRHPQHVILGLALVGIGLILVFNDYYFFWPPFAKQFLNDDLVGGVFVFVGILLIRWALNDKNSVAINRNLLITSSGMLGMEATAEFIHGYVSGHPHMLMAGFMMVITLLFTFSIIGKSQKHENY